MDTVKKIVLAILLLSLAVFIALFGSLPALRYDFSSFQDQHLLTWLQQDTNRASQSHSLEDAASWGKQG